MIRKRVRNLLFVTLAVASVSLAVMASDAHAQDLEPRAYANTPVGLNFLLVGYGYAEGDVLPDPALPVNKHNSVKLCGSTGVFTRSGTDFDAVGMAWQYRWVGGL